MKVSLAQLAYYQAWAGIIFTAVGLSALAIPFGILIGNMRGDIASLKSTTSTQSSLIVDLVEGQMELAMNLTAATPTYTELQSGTFTWRMGTNALNYPSQICNYRVLQADVGNRAFTILELSPPPMPFDHNTPTTVAYGLGSQMFGFTPLIDRFSIYDGSEVTHPISQANQDRFTSTSGCFAAKTCSMHRDVSGATNAPGQITIYNSGPSSSYEVAWRVFPSSEIANSQVTITEPLMLLMETL